MSRPAWFSPYQSAMSDSLQVLSGRSLDWQERREGWCVFAASIDQFAVVGSLMWNAVILFDLLFLVCMCVVTG